MISKLTITQKNILYKELFDGIQPFYPKQDKNGVWTISEEIIKQSTNPLFNFVKKLKLEQYET